MPELPAEPRSQDSPPTLSASPSRWRILWRLPFVISDAVWRVLWLTYFVIAIAFLLVRYVVAPQVAVERPRIEQSLSQQLGLPVRIAALRASWNGLRPELQIEGLQVYDRAGRPALILPRVDASVAWSSVLHLRLELDRLEIKNPELNLRRESDGRIYVAGLEIGRGGEDGGFADFVLAQHEIVIRDARLEWADMQRQAPPLTLEKLNLRLLSDGDEHRFAMLASPPQGYARNLDLRGDLRHSSSGADESSSAPVAKDSALASLKAWRGALYLALDDADLAVWKQWIDYPLALPNGRGGVRAWLNFEGNKLAGLTTDVALAEAALRLAPELPMLELASLSGRLRLAVRDGDYSLSGERLTFEASDGLKMAPTRFAFRYRTPPGAPVHGEFSTEHLDVRVLSQLAAYLPLPVLWRERIVQGEPAGRMEKLALTWQESGSGAEVRAPERFTINASVAALSMHPVGVVPGFEGFSGEVEGDENAGKFSFRVEKGSLNAPALMHEPIIPVDSADIAGAWAHEKPDKPARAKGAETPNASQLTVRLNRASIVNADLTTDFSGFWQARPDGLGYLDLSGQGRHAVIASAWRYIPATVPIDVSNWLKQGILDGRGEDVKLRVKGDLAHFPFLAGDGIFRIETRIVDGKVNFAPGWLGVTGIQGDALFERTRMLIRGSSAKYMGAQLHDIRVEIPDLMDDGRQVLTADGKASGPTTEFLHYVNNSQLVEQVGEFTREVQARGDGELLLHLNVPLQQAENTTIRGEYHFAANALKLVPGLPEFGNATGILGFTEQGVSLPGADADFLGGRLHATGVTESDGSLVFKARGKVPVTGLRQLVPNRAWRHVDGETDASATLSVRKRQAELVVESDLLGVSAQLPAPLYKDSAQAWPARMEWKLDSSKREEGIQSWQLKLDKRLALLWEDRCRDGRCVFARGALAVGDSTSLPQRGWRLSGQLDRLDVDPWRPVVDELLADLKGDSGEGLAGAALKVGELIVAGHRFENLAARALRQGNDWTLQVEGPDLAGDIFWSGEGRGRLQARLSQLTLNPLPGGFEPEVTDAVAPATQDLPGLNVTAARFRVRGVELGQLELDASSQDNAWRLTRISLQAPEYKLTGDGLWRRYGADSGTRLQFKLSSNDLGALLTRFGHANAIHAGKGELEGTVGWRGMPTTIHYPSLAGKMTLKAEEGQFRKLEPGAAGRLIGILSLQALPRRITLDFRDVFSEGFAFDSISGSMALSAGVLHTEDFHIRGPAARVSMTGNTDLAREVHGLRVKVQPTLTETVTVGVVVGQAVAGALNPIIGAATYLAQKILQDPFEKIFSYEYSITGPWSDPKVDKLSASSAASAPAGSK